jgi:hypothetical protein
MGAEHLHQAHNDTDEMFRDGCRVVITADQAGIPIVRISIDPFKSVLVYFHDEIILDATPELDEHLAMIDAAEAAKVAREPAIRIKEAIATRVAGGDPTPIEEIAAEEAAKLGSAPLTGEVALPAATIPAPAIEEGVTRNG